MITAEKTCFKCRVTKPITEFYVHPQMADGRLNKCKECNKKDVSENYRAPSNAIRDGRLIRQPCEVCGALNVEAHHDDYSKPLTVRWLCRRHHLEHHGKVAYEA
jgi:hypothetical protein